MAHRPRKGGEGGNQALLSCVCGGGGGARGGGGHPPLLVTRGALVVPSTNAGSCAQGLVHDTHSHSLCLAAGSRDGSWRHTACQCPLRNLYRAMLWRLPRQRRRLRQGSHGEWV